MEKSEKLTMELGDKLKSPAGCKRSGVSTSVLDAACFTVSMLEYEKGLEETYKKNNGIFYTDVLLAEKIIKSLKLTKNKVILDPCCGTGSFVMAARSNRYHNVYGADQDESAIKLCKDYTGSGQAYCTDTLGVPGQTVLSKIELKDKVDAVVGNPPYAPIGNGVSISAEDREFTQRIYNSGNNLFVAAIYRAFELVKEGGFISYIIPKNFLHVNRYSFLRTFILKDKTIVSIVDIGAYFKNVRGEQIIITIKNQAPSVRHRIRLSQLRKQDFDDVTRPPDFETLTYVNQKFYSDEILLFQSREDFRLYKKMISQYDTLETVWGGSIRRGKSKIPDAVNGKDLRKFGYKQKSTPEQGSRILIQNIYSSESGIIAAFGGEYEAGETVTVFTDGDEDRCRYLLGILHSKLCNFYLFKYCYNNSRLTMHTDAKYLNKIPLVPYGSKKTMEIVRQVKRIEEAPYLSEIWYDCVEALDQMVFKLYKLTQAEVKFVKDEIKKIQSKRWFKDAE